MKNTKIFVEFKQSQYDMDLILEHIKEQWCNEGNKIKDIKTLEIYVKPEDGKVYYVLNGIENQLILL